jgi:hypothetical protein
VLVAGHGTIVAEFFDAGQSRTQPWARRPAGTKPAVVIWCRLPVMIEARSFLPARAAA